MAVMNDLSEKEKHRRMEEVGKRLLLFPQHKTLAPCSHAHALVK